MWSWVGGKFYSDIFILNRRFYEEKKKGYSPGLKWYNNEKNSRILVDQSKKLK